MCLLYIHNCSHLFRELPLIIKSADGQHCRSTRSLAFQLFLSQRTLRAPRKPLFTVLPFFAFFAALRDHCLSTLTLAKHAKSAIPQGSLSLACSIHLQKTFLLFCLSLRSLRLCEITEFLHAIAFIANCHAGWISMRPNGVGNSSSCSSVIITPCFRPVSSIASVSALTSRLRVLSSCRCSAT